MNQLAMMEFSIYKIKLPFDHFNTFKSQLLFSFKRKIGVVRNHRGLDRLLDFGLEEIILHQVGFLKRNRFFYRCGTAIGAQNTIHLIFKTQVFHLGFKFF
jgi:hypothetical protein